MDLRPGFEWCAGSACKLSHFDDRICVGPELERAVLLILLDLFWYQVHPFLCCLLAVPCREAESGVDTQAHYNEILDLFILVAACSQPSRRPSCSNAHRSRCALHHSPDPPRFGWWLGSNKDHWLSSIPRQVISLFLEWLCCRSEDNSIFSLFLIPPMSPQPAVCHQD